MTCIGKPCTKFKVQVGWNIESITPATPKTPSAETHMSEIAAQIETQAQLAGLVTESITEGVCSALFPDDFCTAPCVCISMGEGRLFLDRYDSVLMTITVGEKFTYTVQVALISKVYKYSGKCAEKPKAPIRISIGGKKS